MNFYFQTNMNRYQTPVLLIIYAILAALVIIFFDGNGDSGDSTQHYLFAKFAPQHPAHFFEHWAKPIYVLLACPFAQFGFTGIKIFNALVTLGTLFFTIKTIEKLGIHNSIIGGILLICSPLCFVLTFSGLTEPLFGLLTILSIYLVLEDKLIIACIGASFLPFVRSEGLIILGVFGLFCLYKREWRCIPLLLLGHVVYSIAGFFFYKDFLLAKLFCIIASLTTLQSQKHSLGVRTDLFDGVGLIVALLWGQEP